MVTKYWFNLQLEPMIQRLPYKTKQFFFVLIKISLLVMAFYFIYNKLSKNKDLSFNDFIQFLSKNDVFSLKSICFLVLLSIINWFFEILKWQKLVCFITKVSFTNALKQSLGALTVSLFTPNRIGDYGAKALFFEGPLIKRVLLANLVSNLLQMLVTVLFGMIGMYLLSQKFPLPFQSNQLIILLILSLIIVVSMVWMLKRNHFKIKRFCLENLVLFFKNLPKKSLYLGFIFSFIRYAFFSFQYYYLLILFNVDIGYFEAMTIISSIYLISSIIPSIMILDVVIKAGISVYLFSLIGVNELIVLNTVTCMWILNFVLPSILGSYFILEFKLPKNKTC